MKGLKSPGYKKFGKFCFVGVLNTIVGYGAFYILADHMHYLVALIISHAIGVTHSYVWNRYWIFRSDQKKAHEFLKFNMVYLVVFGANALSLALCVDYLYIKPQMAQLILLPLITVISFFGHRNYSFRKRTDEKGL